MVEFGKEVMKTIIVTGASSAIGQAVVRRAAMKGFAICMAYGRDVEAVQPLAQELSAAGIVFRSISCDVRDEASVMRLFETADAMGGRLVALVNNAGATGGFATVSRLRVEQIREAMDTNVCGTLLCCREAVRRMSLKCGGIGGVIVNVSSTAARTGGAGEWIHYAASKAAVNGITFGLAREVANEGIRVVGVAPGLIQTALHERNGDPERPSRLVSTVPMGRVGEPDEVAAALSWMIGDEASYVTGTTLEIGGGR